ncbi:MAG: iron ABC transporter permease [Bacillota bacterium]
MRGGGITVLGGLLAVTGACVLISLCGGAVRIPVGTVAAMLWSAVTGGGTAEAWPSSWETILFTLRLPRVLLAGLTGASLAAAGATYQGLFQNPMADPFVLGVSAGAALGAAVIMAGGFGGVMVPLAAFVGALCAVAVVYMLARGEGGASVMTLLLAGVATSAFLSGLVSLIIFFSGEEMRAIVYWTMGGLGRANWGQLRMVLPLQVLGLMPLVIHSRHLNAMLMGDETALYLGVDVERVRKLLLVGASMLAAVAVSVGGIIGFVGLIVPHMVRLVAGPDHRFLMPASILVGAPFLMLADLAARTVLSPTELPVGIITAILGGPFFLYLLVRHRRWKV